MIVSAMRLESGTPLQQEVGWTRDLLRTVRYLANTEDDPFIVCCLNNVEDQLKLWTNTFPSIQPTHDVGADSAGEVVESLRQQKVKFNFATKQQLARLVKLNTTEHLVFNNSTKLGSHIKAAVSAGVEDFYVDSVEELAKIKRYYGSARIHVELSVAVCEGERGGAASSLSGVSGARLAELPLIFSEAASLQLAVVGLALNTRLEDLQDHDENLIKIKAGLEVVAVALNIARQNQVEVETIHLGEICGCSTNLPRHYGQQVNNLLTDLRLNNIKLTAAASNFLVSSSTVLATRILTARSSTQANMEYMEYQVTESVFGIFASQLHADESSVPVPLPLGGGGNRKGLTGKMLETTIMGHSGDGKDQILPVGDIVLPRMKEGDWLLFPNMGTSNLAEYVNSGRKIQSSKVFISLKESDSPGTNNGKNNVQSFKQTCDKENVLNINLDLKNQNINFNLGSGLKGEIDLKKTFIFGN